MTPTIPPPEQTTLLAISIPGDPVGKGRPRLGIIAGHAHAYTPKGTVEWERSAANMMRAAWRQAPLDIPVSVTIEAVTARPQRLLRKKDPNCRLWRRAKPDADNVAKACLDAGNGLLYEDDAQVAQLTILRVVAAEGEAPRVEVTVEPFDLTRRSPGSREAMSPASGSPVPAKPTT